MTMLAGPTRHEVQSASADDGPRLPQRSPRPIVVAQPSSSGYLPALDGLRAISVVAVILYHAGFGWMHGGFFGVEVFFVVSGFLITSLLLDERELTGRVSLARFWMRRARRLLPALFVVLAAVTVWALVAGTPEQRSQLADDLPWAIGYGANWGQIVGDAAYFAPVDPPLLRHLWSLAVEEQWYLVWPLAVIALARLGARRRLGAGVLAVLAAAGWVLMWWVVQGGSAPLTGPGPLSGADRVNVAYLATPTRAAGLLAGAALAFATARERSDGGPSRSRAAANHAVFALAAATLGAAFVMGDVTSTLTYPWVMAAVSLASVVAVWLCARCHATPVRLLLGNRLVAAVGRRSYGLYLWHWPVFVAVGATDGDWPAFAVGGAISLGVSEVCYRLVELPARRGAIGRAWARRPRTTFAVAAASACAAVGLAVAVTQVDEFDPAVGGESEAFDLPAPVDDTGEAAAPVLQPAVAASPVAMPAASMDDGGDARFVRAAVARAAATPRTPIPEPSMPELPRSVALVGDSQAHSLAVNLPRGVESFFSFVDGAVSGCGVFDRGEVVTARPGFRNDFAICEGWEADWARAASDSDVALVMLGAWDVFDLAVDGEVVEFGTREWDARFAAALRGGLDALEYVGAHAILLEVGCMRPIDARGAGVPALPERGDDQRVARVNRLLQAAAAADPSDVTFLPGPGEWCGDERVATDRDYRWDGVHVYRQGANLILETIAPGLLAVPVPRR